MRELQEFVSRAYNNYLKPFESQEVLKKCCLDSGKRCIEFFVRHVSIIRPLGAGGRARLTADCNQVYMRIVDFTLIFFTLKFFSFLLMNHGAPTFYILFFLNFSQFVS